MQLDSVIVANHRDMGDMSLEFLKFATKHPLGMKPMPFQFEVFSIDQGFDTQAWPTLVDERKLAEIKRGTVGVTRLIKSMFDIAFDQDVAAFAKHFDMDPRMVDMQLAPPNGIEGNIVRGDFVDSAKGFKCLELNAGTCLGGWQINMWQQKFKKHPPVAEFAKAHGLKLRWRDPVLGLFVHVVKQARKDQVADDIVDVAFVVPDEFNLGVFSRFMNRKYDLLKSRLNFKGNVHVCSIGELQNRRGFLYLGDKRIHLMINYTSQPSPDFVFQAYKLRNVTVFNPPTQIFLSDKRNLAVLSEMLDTDRLSDADREIVEAHIPWSREMKQASVFYDGSEQDLVDLVRKNRGDFVIKPGYGLKGDDVFIGRYMTDEDWYAGVKKSLENGGWLVQEFLESKHLMYQHGEQGCKPHHLVWGMFCFGNAYTGAFLRMVPVEISDGVINAARGAAEGILFEV